MKRHRATGKPRGRPPKLPPNLNELILRDLESRMNKTTRLVLPCIGLLAARLNCSRSSLKRAIVNLRNNGYIELCGIKMHPEDTQSTTYYKMLKVPVTE